jgi:hypothetical protein
VHCECTADKKKSFANIFKILPYTDINLFGPLELYLLELVQHHYDIIVANSGLNHFKQLVSLYLQLIIKVKPSLPHVEVDSHLKEKMKATYRNVMKLDQEPLIFLSFIEIQERMVMCNTDTYTECRSTL